MKSRATLGSSLGVVLVTLTLGSILMFVSMSAGLQQMELSNHLQLRARARDSAESLIHLAIAKLSKDPGFGSSHEPGSVLRCTAPDLGDGCSAVLSFEPATAAAHHIPASTNNLASQATALADGGRTIPGNSCHLVALGQCYSEKIQIETVFIQPPFPTGCACGGPVKLDSVRLWGIPPSAVMQTNASTSGAFLQSVPVIPAHVYSNSLAPDGLTIGPNSSIRGNAACCGGIVQDPSAVVDGEVLPNSRTNTVPHFDVQGMYNNIAQYVGQVPYQEGKPVQSYCVVGNGLNIAGDCNLAGGVLAVRGNVSIQGALKGQGFLIATGSITANGNSAFEGSDKIALLAGGDLVLAGQSQTSHTVNGILYSQGNIRAHDLTVIGSLICDAPNGNGRVDLQRMTVAQTSLSVVSRVVFQPQAQGTANPSSAGQNASGLQLTSDPLNPGQWLLTGSLSHNASNLSGPNHGQGKLPSPYQPGWVISFHPPYATITRWPSGLTTTVPFAGQASPFPRGAVLVDPYANNTGQRYKAFENGPMWNLVKQLTGEPDSTMQVIFSKACHVAWNLSVANNPSNPQYYELELNNVLPAIDRTRVVTWTESAPTR